MERFFYEQLEAGLYEDVASVLNKEHPVEVALLFSEIEKKDLLPLCAELDADFLAEVFPHLSATLQETLLDGMEEEKRTKMLEKIPPEVKAEIIRKNSGAVARRIADGQAISLLLRDKRFPVLKALLSEMNAIDIGAAFDEVEEGELPLLFRLLPKDLAAETFVELDSDKQQKLIARLSDRELRAVTDELFLDDMVDIVEEMPANVVKRILAQSDPETRSYVNELLKYPKDSAGSIMTVEYVCLRPDMTVEDAYDKIRRCAIDSETIYTCYVVDEGKHLIGIVTAKDLLISPKDKRIGDIMVTNLVCARTLDDREYVARLLAEYGFLTLPVVDEEKRLVGIVTVDDAIAVLEEENTEDITKMAAVTPSDKPYLKTGLFTLWRNRIPWLLVLMISATFTGLILNTYEHRLALISTVLFACVPMIMDTGGNAGSQASVTVIRALALNELSTRDYLRVLWKELRVSLLLGATLGCACFGKLMLVDNLLFGYRGYTPFTCLAVSIALICTVVISKCVGCSLPLLAKKVKLDPAVVASPFITTIVDALSLILYCFLAIAMLG